MQDKRTPKLTANLGKNLTIAIRNGGGLMSPVDKLWGPVSNRGEAQPCGMARSSSCGSSRASMSLAGPDHCCSAALQELVYAFSSLDFASI